MPNPLALKFMAIQIEFLGIFGQISLVHMKQALASAKRPKRTQFKRMLPGILVQLLQSIAPGVIAHLRQ